jgi:hypothetical protein
MVDHWVAEIEKWVTKVDRGMGDGRAVDGGDQTDEEAPDPAPRPAD